ncbi:MAG TPA: hypothetical protein VHY79_09030 [Rhizomicrobium sp.]|nr:hypothetical protein [Rhizomicrobium sp.]
MRDIATRFAVSDERYIIVSDLNKRPAGCSLIICEMGEGKRQGTLILHVPGGAPITAPLTWVQVENGVASDAFTLAKPMCPRVARADSAPSKRKPRRAARVVRQHDAN